MHFFLKISSWKSRSLCSGWNESTLWRNNLELLSHLPVLPMFYLPMHRTFRINPFETGISQRFNNYTIDKMHALRSQSHKTWERICTFVEETWPSPSRVNWHITNVLCDHTWLSSGPACHGRTLQLHGAHEYLATMNVILKVSWQRSLPTSLTCNTSTDIYRDGLKKETL